MADPLKVIVCGGRNFGATPYERNMLGHALNKVRAKHGPLILIHGAARGADTLAAEWADQWDDVDAVAYPADWKRWGRSAGVRRNIEMLTDAQPNAVVAFPGGRGTAHMVEIARAADVTVWEIGQNGERVS